jgi:PIN domain nuclease of toxin-antitoxin system
MSAVLDTHTAIWYVFIRKRLSSDALKFIRNSVDRGRPLFISAISLVETIYLMERGRIPVEASRRLTAAIQDPASGLLVAPVDEAIAQSVQGISWSAAPDMPDRIIAATALHLDIPLITRDLRLQSAGIETIW